MAEELPEQTTWQLDSLIIDAPAVTIFSTSPQSKHICQCTTFFEGMIKTYSIESYTQDQLHYTRIFDTVKDNSLQCYLN